MGCHFLLQGIFPTQGSNPGIEPESIALEADALTSEPPGKQRKERKLLSHVQLFATPWTVAYQAPLSMGFSRQEYWSGVPPPSLCKALALLKKRYESLFSTAVTSKVGCKHARKVCKTVHWDNSGEDRARASKCINQAKRS